MNATSKVYITFNGLAPSSSANPAFNLHKAKMTSKLCRGTAKVIHISPKPVRETPAPPPQPRMSRIRADVNVAIAEEDLNMEEAKQRDQDAEHEVISLDEGANLARYGIVVTPPQKWDNTASPVPELGCWRCCIVSIDISSTLGSSSKL